MVLDLGILIDEPDSDGLSPPHQAIEEKMPSP
jgi:hypothetical protein